MTRLRRLACVLLASLVLPLAPLAQPGPQHPLQVGGTVLMVPVPAGFVAAGPRAPALTQLGQTLAPPGNRHLEIFVTPEAAATAAAGGQPELQRYFIMQTLRQVEGQQLSAADFAAVRDTIRQQHRTLLAQLDPQIQQHLADAAGRLSAQAEQPLKLKAGQILPLGLFNDTDSTISLAAATVYQVQQGEQVVQVPTAMALTTLVRRGRLMYFYAYSQHRSEADVAWVRQATLGWSAALRALD